MPSLIPVYYQIKQHIKSWIINRELAPGQKIPSESELAKRFQVSRLTVRQSISQLIQEGFIIARKGEGTFVTNNKGLINKFSLEFTGFMDDLFYQISESKTKFVKKKTILPPKFIGLKLELDAGEEVIMLKRVRVLKNKVFAFTINYLPMSIGTKIKKKDLFIKPLMQILEQDLKIHFTEALQTIEATFAIQEVAEKLGIQVGSPILSVERVMYTVNRKPVEVVQSSYPGDLYKYIVRLKHVGNRKKGGNFWIHQGKK